MELIAFRVTMYKGIIDSGRVEVNPLTVLVGKNESGKTSLLKALHKLNPYTPESYDIRREWPRGYRREQNEEHTVCHAEFRLLDEEKSELVQITGWENLPDTVEVSRNYAGQLDVNFGEGIFSDEPHPNDVDKMYDTLPKIQEDFTDPFKQGANECLEKVRHLVSEKRFAELPELIQKHASLLGGLISQSDPHQQIENNFVEEYLAGIEQFVHIPEQVPSIRSKADEYIINHLPTFIYMDDYRVFSGNAQLDEIKTRQDEERLTAEDKTFLTILNLSGLDLVVCHNYFDS